jgi:hypothetical protein
VEEVGKSRDKILYLSPISCSTIELFYWEREGMMATWFLCNIFLLFRLCILIYIINICQVTLLI